MTTCNCLTAEILRAALTGQPTGKSCPTHDVDPTPSPTPKPTPQPRTRHGDIRTILSETLRNHIDNTTADPLPLNGVVDALQRAMRTTHHPEGPT